MVIYRVKSRKTGLYSKGGTWPSFSKTGKIWKNIGHLRNHFNVLDSHGRRIYKEHDVEIIEIEITEEVVCSTSFDAFIQEAALREQDRKDKRRQRVEAYLTEQRRKQYEELQKEFGK
ncbi:MAG: hypothetical protein CTY12_00515 [Methylotenera sp.]|nr:MAG: hypothetical protein CTY12_00515 [Methylotenera sp.]